MNLVNVGKSVTKREYFSYLLCSIFFCFSLYFISHHAMWGDEIQAWLIARDSHSLYDLYQNTRYEGHPVLWFLLLMGLKQFSGSLWAMQLIHIFIATGAIYLFVRYSPFTNWQKILFIFGYYPFFEYSTLSRNYGIGVLLIFAFCALLKQAQRNVIFIGIVLFFLAQTNIFGLIVCLAAMAYLLLSYTSGNSKENRCVMPGKFFIANSLAVLGIIISVLAIAPPIDSGVATAWITYFDKTRLEGALAAFSNAFFPIPSLQLHFWNVSNWNITFSAYLFAPLAIIICLLLLFKVRKNLPLVAYFVIALVGIEAFLYMKYPGYWRHHGYLYIVFISAIWLSRNSDSFDTDQGSKERYAKFFNRLLNFVLLLHFFGAVIAHTYEEYHPFSSAKLAAQYLSSKGLDNLNVVAFPSTVALLGYLNKPTLYYPDIHGYGSFVRWDETHAKSLDIRASTQSAKDLSDHLRENVIFSTIEPLGAESLRDGRLTLLSVFNDSIFENENFYLYVIKPR